VAAGDLNKERAHWIDRNTIAWDVEPAGDTTALYYSLNGSIVLNGDLIQGYDNAIPLIYDPQGLSAAQKAKFPHLAEFAAFKLSGGDLAMVPEILKGQIAIAAVVPNDPTILFAAAAAGEFTADATGLQIPGVLDDLYTYTGDLGVTYNGDAPTLSLWAPTAKSVKLHIFDTSTSTPTTQILPMTAGPLGVWSATGDASWTGKFYLYEVEVYVHSTGQVEHNLVTDPYSPEPGHEQHAQPDRRSERSGAAAGRLERAGEAGSVCARGYHHLRAARARLQRQRSHRAGGAEGHLQGFHPGRQQRHASPAGVAGGGAEGAAPAAHHGHRHHQREQG
jgi:hypothetical protein